MTPGIDVRVRSLRGLRWRARLPRLAATGCLALLALAGLRGAFTDEAGHYAGTPSAQRSQDAALTFAETFTRVYLGSSSDRERRLRGLMSPTLDPDGGHLPAGRDRRTVDWTAVAAERRRGNRSVVTVASALDGKPIYLAVPVRRDDAGYLVVDAYPALVGGPAADTTMDIPPEREVADTGLRSVCERAVRNYLAGERRNLAADLADGTVVSLPTRELTVTTVDAVTWAQGGRRVAVQVRADDSKGGNWALRYELAVVRRERWYVRSLHVDPRSKGES